MMSESRTWTFYSYFFVIKISDGYIGLLPLKPCLMSSSSAPMKKIFIISVILGFILSCGTENKTTYTLNITVEPSNGGTVEPSSGVYSEGDSVTLTANPSGEFRFTGWQGGVESDEITVSITMNKDYDIVATFSDEPLFYMAENGITIMCPDAGIGEKGMVDGVEYEAVDRELLRQRRDEGFDLSRVCVSNVIDMNRIFWGSSFNQSIENWDVSSVTNMESMFYDSPFNQYIGDWDVSSVTDMYAMFAESDFNQPIGDWDVSLVEDMSMMFSFAPFNQPIGNWDVSSVENMSGMFLISQFNQPIRDWDVSNVTNLQGMFAGAEFDQPIGDWDVRSVTNMKWTFQNTSFNQNIGSWDVGSVENMSGMFAGSEFNHHIGDWDVSNVLGMDSMFLESTHFNQDLNRWCVANISTEPNNFSTGSPLTPENKPVWGTCPS